MPDPHQYIEFVFVDRDANEFVSLGGAGLQPAEARRQFEALPNGCDGPFIADFHDGFGNVVDTVSVAWETVEERLGAAIGHLIGRGRERLGARHAEMAEALGAMRQARAGA